MRKLLSALVIAGVLSAAAMPAEAMPGRAADFAVTPAAPSVEPVYWVWIHHHRYWRHHHHHWHH